MRFADLLKSLIAPPSEVQRALLAKAARATRQGKHRKGHRGGKPIAARRVRLAMQKASRKRNRA